MRKLHFLVYFMGPNRASVCAQWSSDVFAAADPWGRAGERELFSSSHSLIRSKGSVVRQETLRAKYKSL